MSEKNLFDLTGQVAIITGSSRGIGRAIAERMAEHGARVVISSRKLQACEEVVQAINAKHGAGRAVAIAANISSKDDLALLVNQTQQLLGPVDVLVCNAASNPYYGPQAGITDEQFRKILDNNIVANHWLIGMVAPQMIERKSGSIIIVSSIGGLRGSPVIGAYCISKAADMQLARNLAVEFGPHNVRVNCISGGPLRTLSAMAVGGFTDILDHMERKAPLRRNITGGQVGDCAAFLLSELGAGMTGQVVYVDAGYSTIGL